MNKNNPTSTETEPEWQACAPGDLCQFVSVMKKRKKISHLITGAEILTVCLVVGLIGFVGMNQMSGSAGSSSDQMAGKKMPGGINCKQALDYASDYIAHRLDQHTEHQMQVHLAHCPKCQKKVDEIEANRHNDPAQLKAARQKQADWETYVLALNH